MVLSIESFIKGQIFVGFFVFVLFCFVLFVFLFVCLFFKEIFNCPSCTLTDINDVIHEILPIFYFYLSLMHFPIIGQVVCRYIIRSDITDIMCLGKIISSNVVKSQDGLIVIETESHLNRTYLTAMR